MSARSIRRAHARRIATERRRMHRLGLVAGAAALGIGAPAADAANPPITVTNLNDAGGGSLRAAISSANAAAGDDVILFQSGLTGTIRLTTGALSIIPVGADS